MMKAINSLLGLKDSDKLLVRILFWVLIPLVIIAVVVKFLADSNLAGAIKSLKKTEMKDIDLQKEQQEAERKARELKNKADKHGKKAEELEKEAKEAEVDLDWHKKD